MHLNKINKEQKAAVTYTGKHLQNGKISSSPKDVHQSRTEESI